MAISKMSQIVGTIIGEITMPDHPQEGTRVSAAHDELSDPSWFHPDTPVKLVSQETRTMEHIQFWLF